MTVFKLLRSWASLQRLVKVLLALAKEFVYLMLLLGLILFIFALLGMQLFAGVYVPPAFVVPPRAILDDPGPELWGTRWWLSQFAPWAASGGGRLLRLRNELRCKRL